MCVGAAATLLLLGGVVALVIPGLPGNGAATAAAASGPSPPVVAWRLGDRTVTARLATDGLSPARGRSSAVTLFVDGQSGAAVFRGDLLVRWRESASAAGRERVRRRMGLAARGCALRHSPFLLYRAASPLDGLRALATLSADPSVATAAPVLARPRSERALPADPLFRQQWNLLNGIRPAGGRGLDINVAPVWEGTAAGRPLLGSPQEVIAITDDGLQIAHPDLAPNVVAGGSWNWGTNRTDPTPPSSDKHGTAVAGLVAARGYDGGAPGTTPVGICGVAPQAGLLGFRVLVSEHSDDVAESQAILGTTPAGDRRDILDISTASWGPEDDRHLEGPGPLARTALEQGATGGRGGRGIIYVWAAGNGRGESDNVNYDGYANSRFTIAVGSCTRRGTVAPYSEAGAPVMVVAPSGDSEGTTENEITTTDLTGSPGYTQQDYTHSFSGTSASAPQVAGIVALMLQANPELTYRDVQAILMRTARSSGLVKSTWTTNAAGHRVSHDFGYGLVDAAAAVKTAAGYVSPGPQLVMSGKESPNRAIPDGSKTGITGSIDMTAAASRLTLEYVTVDLVAPHSYWHDLEVVLIAPSGTRSVLSPWSPAHDAPVDSKGFRDGWRFGSALHLDESSQGVWRLRVRDRHKGNKGRFVSWSLQLYGSKAGVDTTPPATRVVAPRSAWVNGPVAIRLAARDAGSNVARTEYRIADSSAGAYRVGRSARLQVRKRSHLSDGVHAVWYRSIDNSGNVETASRYLVNVDTRPPSTRTRGAVSVRRGDSAIFRYAVYDHGFSAHSAKVKVRITTPDGRTVRVVSIGNRRTGAWLRDVWPCRLARGVYRYAVEATDAAGNAQSRAGGGRLIVR